MKVSIKNQTRRNTDINKEGTMGYAIKNHIQELNTIRTTTMLGAFMDKIESEVTDKSYFAEIRRSISTSSFMGGYKMLYDIYLKGMGLSESYF